MFTSTFDVITPWHLCSCRMGSNTSFFFLLTSLVPSRLVFQVKVVVVLLFVVHSGALHFKLMLVQQQNVVMCLTLTPWRRKKRVREWEINKKIQDVWAEKLPWAEAMLRANGKVNMVKCCVCLQIEGRKKLLVPKFDSLQKHARRHN